MGLYDVVDDISQRQILKTETGDNRIFGVMIGKVTVNYNKDYPGQVCVEIPVRDSEHNVLKWAKVAYPSAGKKWGSYWLPEVGDEVLVCFEQGNIEKPFIVGCVPKADSILMSKSVDENNKYKDWYFRNGTHLRLEEDVENEGDKEKIRLDTAKGKLFIEISNDGDKILLSDKEKKNLITIEGDNKGLIQLKTEKKLTIEVGDGISVTMNGETGAISIKSKTVSIHGDSAVKLETDGTFSGNGQTVKVSAGNALSLESSGPVKVAGKPIKLG